MKVSEDHHPLLQLDEEVSAPASPSAGIRRIFATAAGIWQKTSAGVATLLATIFDVQQGTMTFAAAGGTADAMTATLSPVPAALVDGQRVFVRAIGANTVTTPTLNVNGLGALTIAKLGNQALLAGDIYGAGHELILVYRASTTHWELLNPYTAPGGGGGGGGGGALTYISTVTISVAAGVATFTGLDLAAVGNYVLEGAFTSASGAITDFRMYVNGDSTAGNYQGQIERELGGTFAGGTTDNKLTDLNANAQLHFRIEMSQFNSGHPVADVHMQEYYAGPTIQTRRCSWMRTSSAANVTSISVAASGNFTGVFKLFTRTP